VKDGAIDGVNICPEGNLSAVNSVYFYPQAADAIQELSRWVRPVQRSRGLFRTFLYNVKCAFFVRPPLRYRGGVMGAGPRVQNGVGDNPSVIACFG